MYCYTPNIYKVLVLYIVWESQRLQYSADLGLNAQREERDPEVTASSTVASQGEPNLSLFYNTAGNSIALEPLVGLRFNLIRFSFKREEERERGREWEGKTVSYSPNHCILKLSLCSFSSERRLRLSYPFRHPNPLSFQQEKPLLLSDSMNVRLQSIEELGLYLDWPLRATICA